MNWTCTLHNTKDAIPAIASCYTPTMSTCTPSAFLATTHCTLAMRYHSEVQSQSNYFAIHLKCNSSNNSLHWSNAWQKCTSFQVQPFLNTPSATLATRSLHRSVTATHRTRAMPRKWTTVKKWDEASLTSGTRLLVKLVKNYNPSIMMVFYWSSILQFINGLLTPTSLCAPQFFDVTHALEKVTLRPFQSRGRH